MFEWITVAYWRDVSRQKREYKAMQARVKALPADYAFVYEKIKHYMWKYAAGSGLDILAILNDLTDLFESGAAEGKTVLEVTGGDVAAFADELLRHATTYTGKWHETLNRDIHHKLDGGQR